jgi:DNA polymerase III subunit delta
MSQPSGAKTAARDRPRLDAPAYLIRGGEEVIVAAAVRDLVRALLAGSDPSLAVEEVGADRLHPPDTEAPSLRPLVDAAQTPPFLTDRRVVVGRDLNLFTRADQLQPLIDYLAEPLPTTALVLVWGQGRIPKNLTDAIARCGGEDIDTSPGRQIAPWVDEQLRQAGLRLDRRSRQYIVEWLGDDPQRLVGVVQTLTGAFGGTAGRELGLDDIEPYLGEPGGVPPWELTDAIDRGDVGSALARLQRMRRGGDRHPLQIMATLHNHYGRILRLDGAPVRGEKEAAQLLGITGSPFPAKKALAQTRKLGHERVVRALDLLSSADLDLRGGKAWPDDLVLEVLVARLAQLSR